MTDLLDPPAERDIPHGTALRVRAEVLGSIGRPRARTAGTVRLRIALVATVLMVSAAAFALNGTTGTGSVQLLAMGPGELSPTLRQAAQQCLTWTTLNQTRVPVSLDDLVMAAERDHRAALLFVTDLGHVACDVDRPAGAEPSGGLNVDRWTQRDWLPGPVQRLLLSSTEADGGDVTVSGRVSERVRRLVLEHGDGETTTARLTGGAFGILTENAWVNVGAELVSYDAAGTEIDRRRLFQPSNEFDHCYVDPTGSIVYGEPGDECRPAERWGR